MIFHTSLFVKKKIDGKWKGHQIRQTVGDCSRVSNGPCTGIAVWTAVYCPCGQQLVQNSRTSDHAIYYKKIQKLASPTTLIGNRCRITRSSSWPTMVTAILLGDNFLGTLIFWPLRCLYLWTASRKMLLELKMFMNLNQPTEGSSPLHNWHECTGVIKTQSQRKTL